MTRSKNILQDDRTNEQRAYLTNVVVGRDTFLSGWGKAKNKISYAGWACKPEHTQQVKKWVESRSDMRDVKIVDSEWTPSSKEWHYHIYDVEEGHPSLNK